LKYYRNYDRNGKSIYTTDISENTSPQHYLDLKIIKKGQGQNDLKGFLSSYMEGSKFYTTQKIGEGDDSELKMGIDIHRKFLEDNDQFVQAKDFSKIEEMAKNNQNIQLISKTNQSRLAHDLELPDELVPVWRVENSMYDVYYIPGYDNWMVNKVKADPNSVGTLSKYKQKFFETLNGQRNLHQGPVDILESELIASEAANMNRTNGIDKQISLSQIQHPTGVGLNHSQFNETGVHQSKVSRVEKTGNLQGPEDNLLKSGTEFWQTSYQASIVDPYKNCTRTTLNPFDFKADGPRKTDKIEDKIRKNRKTQCRTQVTEFNFSYGVHGSNPRSIMPPNSTFKPFINDPLKYSNPLTLGMEPRKLHIIYQTIQDSFLVVICTSQRLLNNLKVLILERHGLRKTLLTTCRIIC